jgi:spermidine/putrescine transport system permease protein
MFLLSIRERVGVGKYATSAGNYETFFNEPLYMWTFVRTAVMSVMATLITLLIGFPVAYYIAKMARGRSQAALFLLCLVPFWVSELVRTFGWMILLRETGVFSSLLQWAGLATGPVEMLYNDAAIMVGLVYTSMLFMVVPLVTTLQSLDDAVIEAGYDLGGSAPSILREIVIPHAMPGIVSGSIVVFMLSLGNYLTPTMLGGKDSLWFTELIYLQFIVRFNWELGAAFGFMLLILSSLIVWAVLRMTGQTLEKTMG